MHILKKVSQKNIKRYTELPFVLQILKEKKLTLLDPFKWDDKNDSKFLDIFKDKSKYSSIYALCFTSADQTYHHWKVFTHGSSGACICFDSDKFKAWIDTLPDIISGEVVYSKVSDLKKSQLKLEGLPFVKREGFQAEKEFRIIHCSSEHGTSNNIIDIPIDIITGVIINPWLPENVFNTIKEIIHSIDGCSDLDVQRSTLISNEQWIKFGESFQDYESQS